MHLNYFQLLIPPYLVYCFVKHKVNKCIDHFVKHKINKCIDHFVKHKINKCAFHFVRFFQHILLSMCIYTIVAISLERCQAICHPLRLVIFICCCFFVIFIFVYLFPCVIFLRFCLFVPHFFLCFSLFSFSL